MGWSAGGASAAIRVAVAATGRVPLPQRLADGQSRRIDCWGVTNALTNRRVAAACHPLSVERLRSSGCSVAWCLERGGKLISEAPPASATAGYRTKRSKLGGHGTCEGRFDDAWHKGFPESVGLAQFAANAPIQDRGFLQLLDLSSKKDGATREAIKRGAAGCKAAGTSVMTAAVIDGHGGWQIADVIKKDLPSFLRCALSEATAKSGVRAELEIRDALQRAFKEFDNELREAIRPAVNLGFSRTAKCGACVCCLVVTESSLVVANTGDCKAVLAKRGGSALPLSRQHNANDPHERSQIFKAHPSEDDAVVCKKTWEEDRLPTRYIHYPIRWVGRLGRDVKHGSCYVKGRLQPTRSFGDFHLKDADFSFDREMDKPFVREPHSFPYITVEPDISISSRSTEDEFVVLGTDGVWDFLSDAQAVDVVRKHFAEKPEATAASAAEEVVSEVLRKAETNREEAMLLGPRHRRAKFDDTTVCIVMLNNDASSGTTNVRPQ